MPPRIPAKARYIGIDPGASGGIAVVTSHQFEVTAMPRTLLHLWELISSLAGNSRAVIESVHAMPKQGVTSSFTFGRGYGGLLMALTAAKIPFEEVRPQAWQKCLGISPRKKDEPKGELKLRLLRKAQQLYPTLLLWNEPKSKGKQLAVCDALLIATYCQRICHGKVGVSSAREGMEALREVWSV